MGYTRGFHHFHLFQLNVLGAYVVEQADAFAEQYGHELNLY